MAKTLQLLRNATVVVGHDNAVTSLTSALNTHKTAGKVGEPIIMRYKDTEESTDEHILLGIVGGNGIEIFDNAGSNAAIEEAIRNLINGASEGFDTLKEIEDVIKALDANSVAGENKVVTDVTQADGQISATASNITSVKIGGYVDGSDAKIAATDTLGGALGKIQGQINAMDLTEVGGTNGDVITAVSEADGKVSATKASLKDVKLTGYVKDAAKTGAIAATDDVEDALSKVENAIATNAIVSDDESITVAASATAGTSVSVNVDAATIVKDATNKYIKSGLTIQSIAQSAGSTYASQYKLVDANGTQIGDTISVGKDQFLKEAAYDPATQKLTLTMWNSTGGTTDIEVDFSAAIIEAEAGDGLYVKADKSLNVGVTTNNTLTTGASTTEDALTVGADGLVVGDIQGAINYAVSSSAVQAQGDDYVSASIDANNNKKVVVDTNVQDMTATAGTPGVYDAEGAQTTAPVAGTLSGVADSLVDGSDAATKVKTYVDGAVAIEAARTDAKVLAAVKALDVTDAAVSGQFVTSVSETDGEISVSRANLGTAVIAGFTQDASASGDIAATDTLADALNKLENKADNGLDGVAAGNGINVSAKANKSQTITAVAVANDPIIEVTSSGIGTKAEAVFDCGTY